MYVRRCASCFESLLLLLAHFCVKSKECSVPRESTLNSCEKYILEKFNLRNFYCALNPALSLFFFLSVPALFSSPLLCFVCKARKFVANKRPKTIFIRLDWEEDDWATGDARKWLPEGCPFAYACCVLCAACASGLLLLASSSRSLVLGPPNFLLFWPEPRVRWWALEALELLSYIGPGSRM